MDSAQIVTDAFTAGFKKGIEATGHVAEWELYGQTGYEELLKYLQEYHPNVDINLG